MCLRGRCTPNKSFKFFLNKWGLTFACRRKPSPSSFLSFRRVRRRRQGRRRLRRPRARGRTSPFRKTRRCPTLPRIPRRRRPQTNTPPRSHPVIQRRDQFKMSSNQGKAKIGLEMVSQRAFQLPSSFKRPLTLHTLVHPLKLPPSASDCLNLLTLFCPTLVTFECSVERTKENQNHL